MTKASKQDKRPEKVTADLTRLISKILPLLFCNIARNMPEFSSLSLCLLMISISAVVLVVGTCQCKKRKCRCSSYKEKLTNLHFTTIKLKNIMVIFMQGCKKLCRCIFMTVTGKIGRR
ncbi:hypothetical protein HF669_09245 [Acidithiobacillus thiooxidans]|uniref:hypothetical protein n=1 Tax=Acidithiobacillus thiooxidans TaxID=930 RepID=UPI00114545A5|nr:hypothetical protein [Acidithiobacillus thiooxidans]MBU2811545.1 hypothetical protein [Acidithiobacillus thiooxidans]